MRSAGLQSPDWGDLGALSDAVEQLGVLARELPGEESTLWDDQDFQRDLFSLQIECLGLRSMQARLDRAAAEPRSTRSLRATFEHRLQRLALRLSEITISALGYYALPFPDPLLLHNEGPIGPEQALPAMRQLEGYFQPVCPEQGLEHKNVIAGHLFDDQQ